jgi:RimJ/RimL family protein N-acetyltransferase
MSAHITVGVNGAASSREAVTWAANEAAVRRLALPMVSCVESPMFVDATFDDPATNSMREASDADHSARLMTGQSVDIDRASPGDLEAVRAFYARLGDTSTYYRFFGLRRHLPEGELLGVVGESAEHVTLLASIGEELIGIGEFIIGNNPTQAEVAFAVDDDHHREGVATLLLERLAVIAHDRGLLTFTATVLPGNADMQLVFKTVGLTVRSRFDDGVVKNVLELSSLTSLNTAAAARGPHVPAATPSNIEVTARST